ncbi:MAG TPA: hypothetical protein VE134_08320, partial [Methanomicrobiales archaeon]|nr:hypothetical protein [Methanomicrobiales archaeon]
TLTAAEGSTIPLQVSYKDADGNTFTSTDSVTLTVQTGQNPQPAGVSPLLGILLAAAAFSGGLVLYLRRRK